MVCKADLTSSLYILLKVLFIKYLIQICFITALCQGTPKKEFSSFAVRLLQCLEMIVLSFLL